MTQNSLEWVTWEFQKGMFNNKEGKRERELVAKSYYRKMSFQ